MIRAAFFGSPIPWTGVIISFISASIMMVAALAYFKKAERNFVDII